MDSEFEALIISYLEKTISPEQEKHLLEYLSKNPQQLKELNDFKQLWKASGMVGNYNQVFLEEGWKKLLLKTSQIQSKKQSSGGLILYWLPRIAAVFLLGAVCSFAITYLVSSSGSETLTYHEISTPPGAKSKVTLPDGSTIWLNAGSNLKYPSQFGKKNRTVELEGEALFSVQTNPAKAFVVQTSEINIKAYGTEFNVKSYPEEGTIEATLIKGSIGITRTRFTNKKTDEVMLEPNQRVVYYKKNQAVTTSSRSEKPNELKNNTRNTQREQKLTYLISKGINTNEYTSWKEGTLIIASESLEQLAVKLERKYDVKIHFDDESLKNLKFTGSLENETVEQVIEAIGIAAQIDYEIDERDIWLKKQTE